MPAQNNIINKAAWFVIGLIFISSIILVKQFSPYIPDYDGLIYLDTAKTINNWLFNKTDYKLWNNIANDFVLFWPITNAASILIASIFWKIIDLNILPAVINLLYLSIFYIYLKKIKSSIYAYITILALVSQTFIFRLFTTLTTEFAVGLWIYSFLLTLILNNQRREIYLAALTIIGLLLRTIDIVFILMSLTAYIIIHTLQSKDKNHTIKTIKYTSAVLILTLPIFFQHYKVAYSYIYNASFGFTAASWKSLGGVNDRYDVIYQYVNFLTLYNPIVFPLMISIIIIFMTIDKTLRKPIILRTAIAFAMCLPLLLASSLNIQVVFWIYTSIIFIICETGYMAFKNREIHFEHKKYSYPSSLFFILINLAFIIFFFRSWAYEIPYLKQQQTVSKISSDITSILEKEEGTPVIASNFRGVGALDIIGLSLRRNNNFLYGGVEDIYSKDKTPEYYLKFKKNINFFIASHENYFFASHFGINDHIKQTHEIFTKEADSLGFIKVKDLSIEGRNFDIWYKPGVHAYLQYINYQDTWISKMLPLNLGSKELCKSKEISGNIFFSAIFPNPNSETFKPPFRLSLRQQGSDMEIASAIVSDFGTADVIFHLENINCGSYELHVDKSFSPNNDPRKLSAQFLKISSDIKFNKTALQ